MSFRAQLGAVLLFLFLLVFCSLSAIMLLLRIYDNDRQYGVNEKQYFRPDIITSIFAERCLFYKYVVRIFFRPNFLNDVHVPRQFYFGSNPVYLFPPKKLAQKSSQNKSIFETTIVGKVIMVMSLRLALKIFPTVTPLTYIFKILPRLRHQFPSPTAHPLFKYQ